MGVPYPKLLLLVKMLLKKTLFLCIFSEAVLKVGQFSSEVGGGGISLSSTAESYIKDSGCYFEK